MKIYLPNKKRQRGWANQIEMHGDLRDLSKIGDDKWQLKFDVPRISGHANFYIGFTDEEIDYLFKTIFDEKQEEKMAKP